MYVNSTLYMERRCPGALTTLCKHTNGIQKGTKYDTILCAIYASTNYDQTPFTSRLGYTCMEELANIHTPVVYIPHPQYIYIYIYRYILSDGTRIQMYVRKDRNQSPRVRRRTHEKETNNNNRRRSCNKIYIVVRLTSSLPSLFV